VEKGGLLKTLFGIINQCTFMDDLTVNALYYSKYSSKGRQAGRQGGHYYTVLFYCMINYCTV